MKSFALACLALGVAACQSIPPGEPAANRARGLLIAKDSCGGCHQTRRNGSSPNPDAPPFADIANREGLTAEALSSWLRDSHNYPAEMGFYLDQRQIDNLAVYMIALRSGGADR